MPSFNIRGINVEFPFEAYPSQITYMDRVIHSLQTKCHALLESPTGTGKTLSLLCATLAWRKSLGDFSTGNDFRWTDSSQSGGREFPTIVYASRTHSQLRQVIKELKRCSYRPKMMILGSREQLCVNKEVKSLRGKALTNACQDRCKKKGGRQCNHFDGTQDYLEQNPHIGDEPVDIEDLLKIGKDNGPCPYYLTREVHKDVDIVFAPYNYLIGNAYRKYVNVEWKNSVLIFDEAHNLESLCADSASFDLSSMLLSGCISEAQECVKLAAGSLNDVSMDPENFALLEGFLLNLQELIDNVPILKKDEGFTRPGPYIYEMLRGLDITHLTAPDLIATVEEAAVLLEEEKQGTKSKLEIIADILKVIFRGNGSNHADVYRVHVQEELEQNSTDIIEGKASRTLSWWCFSPGITMQEIANKGVGSIILTSGTLSPLDSLALELKLDFPIRLENPHVISSNQLWAGVVSSGSSGHILNSSFHTRDVPEYKQELGNTIVDLSRVVPDGLLIYFPSYYLMDRCIDYWKYERQRNSMTIWERICELKKPVIEPKDSSLFPAAMQDYSDKLQDRSISGAVFFAVCRGKVSEGLDFADGAGRAVVITGLPYARTTDPRVKLKRGFLDEQSRLAKGKFPRTTLLTGRSWYNQEAVRAVNQAIGRVIRHRHDYGAIILCDKRFVESSVHSNISPWIRPSVKGYSRYGEVISDLALFFQTERSNLPASLVPEQENNIALLSVESSKNAPTPASGNSHVKNVGVAQNEFSRLEAFPPANQASHSERDGNNIKWKGLTIVKRTRKLPSIIHMQACSKAKLVDLSDEEDPVEKQTCETQVLASTTMGLVKKRKVPESKGSATPSVLNEKGKGGGDKKEDKSAFLSQAKEKLDTEEYKKFIGYMQALKKKELELLNVMPSIVRLFSGSERLHLLIGFKKFVPEKYRPAYEECIIKGDGMQACSSKAKLVVLSDEEDPVEKQTCETQVLASTTMGRVKKQNVLKSQGSASPSVLNEKGKGGGDKKEVTASAFSSQAKEKLNTEEYKKFIGYVQGWKKKELNVLNVMPSIVQLFCGTEREHLLIGFKNFVPVKYRPAYEECIKTRKR